MRHKFILVPIILICSGTSVAQTSLGSGNALDSSTSSLGTNNISESLPYGVRNSELRGNSLMKGRSFNQGLGRGDDVSLQLLKDASNESDASYQDALNNSTWYWNNWSKQSTQFLKNDRSYFNPTFIDNWSTAPQKMSEGRAIRTYAHEWNPEDAKKYGGDGKSSYDSTWSLIQKNQHQIGQVLGSGYQTPSVDTSPLPVGEYNNETIKGYLAASPMTGVSLETLDRPFTALGFTAWDEARATEDYEAGIGTTNLVQAWRSKEGRLNYEALENRVAVPEQYINLLDEIARKAQNAVENDGLETTTMEWLDEQYSDLQDDLTGMGDPNFITEEMPNTDEDEDLSIVAEEEIVGALRHGERIDTFSGVQKTRFNELVKLAETALAKGEYFLSQKRFTQALQFIPGHPMATAGLAHANLGAGLYLSASHILQSLLSFQPEMIDVLYSPQLLPPRLELVRAGIVAKNRLENERDGSMYAFLLAYIGHQIQDDEMLELGFSELDKYSDKDDRFVPLLRSIWRPSPE
ncbi:MAG TPA: hypothetical protein EYO01_05940 [Phycisphaerales bacterium]|nr:hypothetical protein [Phycisphaerales bacterium]HIB01481.1 hypothetical protein [Phycisphaerales bacterium]HIB50541.1 hypothetical protein [Phycisphaerales bacterium]HIN83898.1 hypothetical protein [Phycisphaerales bacterium]HIO52135.1 hypothetical protein [Phycisphaerales bacterium]